MKPLLTLLFKIEGYQIAFSVGAVVGMVTEAVFITVPKIAFVVVRALW